MSWETILKRNWSGRNLPMLKEVIEEMYSKIPVGKVFSSVEYWDDFQKILTDKLTGTREYTYFRRWATGRGEGWFRNYFTAYGKRRGYVEPKSVSIAGRNYDKIERV